MASSKKDSLVPHVKSYALKWLLRQAEKPQEEESDSDSDDEKKHLQLNNLPADFNLKLFLKSMDRLFRDQKVTTTMVDAANKSDSDEESDDEQHRRDRLEHAAANILSQPLKFGTRRAVSDARLLVELFADIPAFQTMEYYNVLQICRTIEFKEFRANETIFDVGDFAQYVYIIRSGAVLISSDCLSEVKRSLVLDKMAKRVDSDRSVANSLGGSQSVSEHDGADSVELASIQKRVVSFSMSSVDEKSHINLGPFDMFGERSVTHTDVRPSSAVCQEPTTLLLIDRWTYHRYFRDVSENIVEMLHDEYIKLSLPFGPPLEFEGDDSDSDDDEAPTDEVVKARLNNLADRVSRASESKQEPYLAQAPPSRRSTFLTGIFNRKTKASVKVANHVIANLTKNFNNAPDNVQTEKLKSLRELDARYLNPVWLEEEASLLMRFKKASLFIDDAINNRTVRPHRSSKWARRFDRFFSSSFYEKLLFFVILAHVIMAAFEAPSYVDTLDQSYGGERFWTIVATEWFFILFYMSELLWQLNDLGKFWFMNSAARMSRTIIVLAILCDLILYMVFHLKGHKYLRFSRALRPFLFLYGTRFLRTMFKIALRVLPRLTELGFILLFLVTFFAMMGFNIFNDTGAYNQAEFDTSSGVYTENCAPDTPSNITRACGKFDEYVWQSFVDPWPESFIAMIVMLTRASYPDVAFPVYVSRHVRIGFFIIFQIIGVFFLMNLVVATVVNSYREIHKELILGEIEKEKTALSTAFKILDLNDAGVIDWGVFRTLLKVRKASAPTFKVRAMFVMMDKDGDGVLDEDEFCEIVDALFINIDTEIGHIMRTTTDVATPDTIVTESPWRAYLALIVGSIWWESVFVLVIILDIVSLILENTDDTFGGIIIGCEIAFAAEILIYAGVMGISRIYQNPWRLFDVMIVLFTTTGLIVSKVFDSDEELFTAFQYFGMLRAMRVSKFTANFRSLRHSAASLEGVTTTVIKMVPVFFAMVFAMLTMVFFPFSIVGMEIFHGSGLDGRNRCDDFEYLRYQPEARFCDLPTAMISLFQIIVGPSWHIVMYRAMHSYNNAVSIYFILFYIFAVVILLNLLLAVFLDMFLLEQSQVSGGQKLMDVMLAKDSEAASDTSPLNNRMKPSSSSASGTRLRKRADTSEADQEAMRHVVVHQKAGVQRLFRQMRNRVNSSRSAHASQPTTPRKASSPNTPRQLSGQN